MYYCIRQSIHARSFDICLDIIIHQCTKALLFTHIRQVLS